MLNYRVQSDSFKKEKTETTQRNQSRQPPRRLVQHRPKSQLHTCPWSYPRSMSRPSSISHFPHSRPRLSRLTLSASLLRLRLSSVLLRPPPRPAGFRWLGRTRLLGWFGARRGGGAVVGCGGFGFAGTAAAAFLGRAFGVWVWIGLGVGWGCGLRL